MLVEALIVTFVYILGRCEWFLGSSNIRRPIVLGTILGILLGQPAQGAIMGATLNLHLSERFPLEQVCRRK